MNDKAAKEKLNLEDKLYRTRYEPDTAHSHVSLSEEKQDTEDTRKLLKICPAEVYKPDPNDESRIAVSHENCLECGTCRKALEKDDTVEWKYPDGGKGVKYRYG